MVQTVRHHCHRDLIQNDTPRFGLGTNLTQSRYWTFLLRMSVEFFRIGLSTEFKAYNMRFSAFIFHENTCAFIVEEKAVLVSKSQVARNPTETIAGNEMSAAWHLN